MSAFSLDLFLPSLFLKKVLAELSTKDIRKKGQVLEKEKQEQGTGPSAELEPKPHGKGLRSPPHLLPPQPGRLGRSWLARYDNSQEGTRQSIGLRRNAVPKSKLLDVSPDPSPPEFYEHCDHLTFLNLAELKQLSRSCGTVLRTRTFSPGGRGRPMRFRRKGRARVWES